MTQLYLVLNLKGLKKMLELDRQCSHSGNNTLKEIPMERICYKGYLISQTVSDQLQNINFENDTYQKSVHQQFNSDLIKSEELLTKLSYSHFLELIITKLSMIA
ncbi:hypothetical protein EDF66_101347 [Sphingobacterium sp. JUb20]|nr:hypothetical protein [Sphingobacterium sp. JUb21]TCR10533.1 hypothetical protein EDF66_101347 [Sphingobacterium sp. JUb20]